MSDLPLHRYRVTFGTMSTIYVAPSADLALAAFARDAGATVEPVEPPDREAPPAGARAGR